ncbi:pyridoxamine 5'-phosphate oxidase family protein [Planctomyces sp. SH-PL14]|uniref:pyridoxamine 5'-phosphate oxidase family protein n=1 Tax=Planctomyces sp. SH-PL14 TaxID=1632864 RepID=UPI00078DD33E|nr:pyridoxamine 5'-phosphate oxidase family protein [Planctomyces sp. SH-PL14]AMV22342.1 Pyridoxamine 5'-phosphate oxidase [Planctomyces sp. SH-PL14]
MDSINKNQPEDPRRDLAGPDAVAKIQEIVAAAENCFFCTTSLGTEGEGGTPPARPMNVRSVDDAGRLWFLSASDSHKNRQLARDPHVTLYFHGTTHADFLQLHGVATISTDRQRIESLWNPVLKTWFTEGVTDPRITVIQVTPTSGYYWDTKHGRVVAGIKMLIGAALGTTLDDSVEGTVRP